MACPYFDPVEPRGGPRPQDSMLPLGGHWRGVCAATAGAPARPDDAMVHTCNLGYARGACPHFPGGAAPDAVRFTISSDAGERILIYHVIERDHHPYTHGPLAYSRALDAIEGLGPDAILARQALAYVHSYLHRKSAA